MVFGYCCYLKNEKLSGLQAKSVKIEGNQVGLIINFEMTQTFIQSDTESQEVHYVFPNDLKLCIYDMTFIVDGEVIKPKLQRKEEAEKTYQEAIEEGRTAIFGSNIGHGMTEFKLGNLPPNSEVNVVIKIAFTAQITKENLFFIKFPLDVYSPSGSNGCLDVNSSNFLFTLQCDKKITSKITSNVKNFKFNENDKIFTISEKVENESNQKSIIINFETNEQIKSSAIIGSTVNNYNYCAITISPNLSPSTVLNNEFLFLVDCSGSMRGQSIKKASECLEIFIRSLPSKSFFNIVRFGSRYVKLFENSIEYNDETAEKGIQLAQTLDANLGGTNIYSPLSDLYNIQNEHGQRQVFILTDGEVNDVEKVLELIRTNASKNRCFTIGIGRGCDAGLVEGMANASGGKSDFVQEGDSISEKVIPQLKSSIHPSLTSIEVHLSGEGNDAFEVSPFPIPSVNATGSSVVYLRQKVDQENKNQFKEEGLLISGIYGNETVEFQVDEIITENENDSIGHSILPLFAFNILQSYERKSGIIEDDKSKAVELSISSGVLCKFTAFVGMTESSKMHRFHNSRRVFTPGCCIQMDCCQMPRGDPPMHHFRGGGGGVRGGRRGGRRGGMQMCCMQRPPPPAACCPMAKASRRAPMHIEMPVDDHEVEVEVEAECFERKKQKPPSRSETKTSSSVEQMKSSQSKSDDFDFLKLMRYQKIGGYWENLNAVNEIVGVGVSHVDGVDVGDKDLEEKCIATLVAVAALHVKSRNEENTWSMIEEKAVNWLKSNLKGVDVDQIIQKIEDLIKSSK